MGIGSVPIPCSWFLGYAIIFLFTPSIFLILRSNRKIFHVVKWKVHKFPIAGGTLGGIKQEQAAQALM
jgi:hypothetical protein